VLGRCEITEQDLIFAGVSVAWLRIILFFLSY